MLPPEGDTAKVPFVIYNAAGVAANILLTAAAVPYFFIHSADSGMFAFLLALFFMCFNVLEASLPGLISRAAPKREKGLALGGYNTTQNLGLFIGGAAGGWISQHYNAETVFLAAAFVMLCSFASSTGLKEPKRTIRRPGDALEV